MIACPSPLLQWAAIRSGGRYEVELLISYRSFLHFLFPANSPHNMFAIKINHQFAIKYSWKSSYQEPDMGQGSTYGSVSAGRGYGHFLDYVFCTMYADIQIEIENANITTKVPTQTSNCLLMSATHHSDSWFPCPAAVQYVCVCTLQYVCIWFCLKTNPFNPAWIDLVGVARDICQFSSAVLYSEFGHGVLHSTIRLSIILFL